MSKNSPEDSHRSRESICSRLIDENSKKSQMIEEQQLMITDENTQILIDSDNEEDFTSSGISEDEQEEEENYQTGNILQSIYQSDYRTNLNTPYINNLLVFDLKNCLFFRTLNISFIQTEEIVEANQRSSDQLISQTMSVLASKHRHIKPVNSPLSKAEMLSFIGPCPLYSLESSFGLDMYHGLSYFPCGDVLVNGRGHIPASPLWQHLTSYHNLNISSSSVVISHLLLHGYLSPSPILFARTNPNDILRTTPRYCLMKNCPLTKYGIYGIEFEHGTRLCSGYTYNTNIYFHLISFHKMTNDAALRLSRAIAFHDKQFQFQSNEIIVSEYIKSPLIKICQIRQTPRLINNQCHLFKKILRTKSVNKISN